MTKDLTPHFTDTELACRCGCGMIPAQPLLDALEAARLIYGRPIHITSGARCETYNRDVGGSLKSAHITGLAVDLAPPTGPDLMDLISVFHGVLALIRATRNPDCGGFGMGERNGQRLIHFDVAAKRAWMY